jgi:hypothetical protein
MSIAPLAPCPKPQSFGDGLLFLGESVGWGDPQVILIYGDGSKPWYLVHPKIAGKWMFIPLKIVCIGIDP